MWVSFFQSFMKMTYCVLSSVYNNISAGPRTWDRIAIKRLLFYCRPHGPASKDTVSRWLRNVLLDAGIYNFAAHSFRGAASSAMLRNGMPLDEILNSAGWANASTFHSFYNRPVAGVNQETGKNDNSTLKYLQRALGSSFRMVLRHWVFFWYNSELSVV